MSAEFLLSRIVDVVAGWSPAAGVSDHGALTGNADDDHTQYLKEKASGGIASELPEHNHTEAAEGGTLLASAAGAYNSIDQAISTSGEAIVTMDSETFDTDGYHSTLSNTGRFTIPAGLGGLFGWAVNLRISDNTEGYVVVRKNDTTILGLISLYNGAETLNARGVSMSGIIDLAATEYIELKALGVGAKNIITTTQPWFAIWRIGD